MRDRRTSRDGMCPVYGLSSGSAEREKSCVPDPLSSSPRDLFLSSKGNDVRGVPFSLSGRRLGSHLDNGFRKVGRVALRGAWGSSLSSQLVYALVGVRFAAIRHAPLLSIAGWPP